MNIKIYILLIALTIIIREVKIIADVLLKKDLTFKNNYSFMNELVVVFKISVYNFMVIIIYNVLKDIMGLKYKYTDYIFVSIALFQLILFTILVDIHKFLMTKKTVFAKLILSSIKDDDDKLYIKLKEVVNNDDNIEIPNRINMEEINKEVGEEINNNISASCSSEGKETKAEKK